MAADLDISAPYVALLERNQRPVTADMLLRLARTYKIDIADLAGDGGADHTARLQAVLKDPMFADIDMPSLEISDVATSYPGMTEAFLRLYTAYREEQLALADRGVAARAGGASTVGAGNSTPTIRSRKSGASSPHAATISRPSTMPPSASSRSPAARADFIERLKIRHNLDVRYLPPDVMLGSVRRLDRHRRQLLLDDSLDTASLNFQLAQQLAYLEMENEIGAARRSRSFRHQERRAARAPGARRLRRGGADHALLCVRESSRDASLRSRSAGAAVRHQLRADRASRHDAAAAGAGKGARSS